MVVEKGKPEEIKITPEMIEAGASAVTRAISPSRLYAPMDAETLAGLVYRAMARFACCKGAGLS